MKIQTRAKPWGGSWEDLYFRVEQLLDRVYEFPDKTVDQRSNFLLSLVKHATSRAAYLRGECPYETVSEEDVEKLFPGKPS